MDSAPAKRAIGFRIRAECGRRGIHQKDRAHYESEPPLFLGTEAGAAGDNVDVFSRDLIEL